jgi:RimJ/RimL family protein N-acetyltransferase
MSQARLLTIPDIPQAMLLKQTVGWNQTEQDWRRLLELEPEGCFAIEHEGRLAATITSTRYGSELAWIGMVITAPEFRGRGFASRLIGRALEYLDGRGTQWVKLDATSLGRDLYRRFGFEDECPVERWLRAPAPARVRPVTAAAGEWDAAFDRRVFGADRNRLLSKLARGESASIPGLGFAMARPGANAAYFGPCVAGSLGAARSLLEWFLSRHANEAVYWDLLPENHEVVRLAEHFGFERSRQLVRMARQSSTKTKALITNAQEIYAIAGFEFG